MPPRISYLFLTQVYVILAVLVIVVLILYITRRIQSKIKPHRPPLFVAPDAFELRRLNASQTAAGSEFDPNTNYVSDGPPAFGDEESSVSFIVCVAEEPPKYEASRV